MAIRDFLDDEGLSWRVWSTIPSAIGVPAGRFEAWLTFESDRGRRRLSPIPAGWEHASPAQLARLCANADVVPMSLNFRAPPRAV
jgi:hypothetical protein